MAVPPASALTDHLQKLAQFVGVYRVTVAEIPPTSAIADQLPKLVGHVVSKMNRKAIIRKKASSPLEDYLDVVSAISAKEPNGKSAPKRRSPGGLRQPYLTEG